MRQPPPPTEFYRYPVTAGTIALAIGATLAYWQKVPIEAVFVGPGVRQWQLWRLVTSALPHVDLLHLIFNIYWVWVFGTLVESVFGSVRSALLYILLAAGSGAAEYATFRGGMGLSGVGYGLLGMLWVLSYRDERFKRVVDPKTIALFVAWFFYCIFLTVRDVYPVANVAHGVGAVLGALIGWAVVVLPPRRLIPIGLIGTLVLASIAGATVARSYVNFSNRAYDEEFLGYNALVADRNDEAAQWYREAVRIEPGNSRAWFNLGLACHRLGRTQEAGDAFKRAHELAPGNNDYAAAAKRYP